MAFFIALPFVMVGDPLLKLLKWAVLWFVPIERQPFAQPRFFIRIYSNT